MEHFFSAFLIDLWRFSDKMSVKFIAMNNFEFQFSVLSSRLCEKIMRAGQCFVFKFETFFADLLELCIVFQEFSQCGNVF